MAHPSPKYLQPLARRFAGACLALLTGVAQANDNGPEFARYLDVVWPELGTTAAAKQILHSDRSYEYEDVALRHESPWTINASSSRQEQHPDPVLLDSQRTNVDDLKTTLDLESRYGLSLVTDVDNSFTMAHLHDPLVYGARDDQRTFAHKIDETLAYDIIKGGSTGLGAEQEAASVALNDQLRLQNQEALQTFYLTVYGQFVDYYVALCKRDNLRAITELNRRIVDAARVKASARVISEKDLLVYLDTDNAVRLRVSQQVATVATLLSSMLGLSESIRQKSQEFGAGKLDCAIDIDATLARAERLQLDTKVVKKLPSVTSADAGRVAAQHQIRVAELNNTFSLKPFVTGSYDLTPYGTPSADTGSVAIGLQFQWVPPLIAGAATLASAKESYAAAAQGLATAELQARSRILTLATTVSAQRDILAASRTALENSAQLLKAIETQAQAGIVDTLTFASAQLNQLTEREALLDAWSSLKKTIFEADYYAAVARGGVKALQPH